MSNKLMHQSNSGYLIEILKTMDNLIAEEAAGALPTPDEYFSHTREYLNSDLLDAAGLAASAARRLVPAAATIGSKIAIGANHLLNNPATRVASAYSMAQDAKSRFEKGDVVGSTISSLGSSSNALPGVIGSAGVVASHVANGVRDSFVDGSIPRKAIQKARRPAAIYEENLKIRPLCDHISEIGLARQNLPAAGDRFLIVLEDGSHVQTIVEDSSLNYLVLAADDVLLDLFEHCGCEIEDDVDESLTPMVPADSASAIPGRGRQDIEEAKYQGREVQLGKPMTGDVKKYKVYVRDPQTGNIKKVNFGDKKLSIKRDDPKRRKNFRARHRCATAKDRTSARYWSCRFWSRKPVSKILKGK